MTQVGHILTGATIGVISMPEGKTFRWKLVYFVAFGWLALAPDWRIKHWGHYRYNISHSIFTNALAILVLVVILYSWKGMIPRIGGWGVVIGGIIAWLSHLLLDTFYNHGRGIAMFWPFSRARVALPIPWFSVVSHIPPPMTWEIWRILLIELFCYGVLLLGAIVLRRSGVLKRIAQSICKLNSSLRHS